LPDNLQRQSHKRFSLPTSVTRQQPPCISSQLSTSAHPLTATTWDRQHRSSSNKRVTRRHLSGILAIDAKKFPQEYRNLHRFDYINTLTYAHKNLRTCDSSLGSLPLRAPEAGDFMESIEPQRYSGHLQSDAFQFVAAYYIRLERIL